MAVIIAFVSQKGGVGKSTLARALAREGAKSGLRVKLADLDTQQGTAVDWHRTRLAAGIEPVISAEAYATAAQALAVAPQYDLLVLDGPARTSAATLEIARNSSVVVQPTGAAADDLRPAVREFHALAKAGIPKVKLVFALNRIGTDSLFECGSACGSHLTAASPKGARDRRGWEQRAGCGQRRTGRGTSRV